jgi:hypothetical protein
MADDLEQIRGKNVVAAIDFHETVIYMTDAAPRQRPERLVATDPHGHFTKSTTTPEIPRAPTGTTVRRTGTN